MSFLCIIHLISFAVLVQVAVRHYSTSKDNIKNFIYTHLDDTGEYVLNLKANSNKKDEMVSYKVYLENGRSYLINLGLEHFDYKNVVVNKFTFEK